MPPQKNRIALAALSGALAAVALDAASGRATPSPQAPEGPSSRYAFTVLAGAAGTPGFTDATGTAARFNQPLDVALDGNGNLYVTDSGNLAVRKITPGGVVTTVAALAASPWGVAVTSNGDLYVSTTSGISRVTAAGVVTPVAGLDASNSLHLAVDAFDNVFFARSPYHAIWKSTPGGFVTGVAGGVAGGADGPGASATFNGPRGVAFDGSGNLFVTDFGNHKIRKVTSDGTVSTVAGLTLQPGSADGAGASARFSNPWGIAADTSGTLFVADTGNNAVRAVAPDGAVTTLAGGGGFAQIAGIAADAGAVYVVDSRNHTVLKGTATPETIPVLTTAPANQTVAIGGTAIFSVAATGAAPLANQWQKNGVNLVGQTSATLTLTNVQAADAAHYAVIVSNGAGTLTSPAAVLTVGHRPYTFTVLAGSSGVPGNIDATGTAARFNQPRDVAADAGGNLFVTDGNNALRKVTPSGVVTTVAALAAAPWGVGVTSSGDLYVSTTSGLLRVTTGGDVATVAGLDASNSLHLTVDGFDNALFARSPYHAIWKSTPGGFVTGAAGSGLAGGADGAGASATFNAPRGVAFDGIGNLLVTDYANHKIRKVTPDGTVTTVAGLTLQPGSADGTGTGARFSNPWGITVDDGGTAYVADTGNNAVRAITPAGAVTTIAGGGSFAQIAGIEADATGTLYVVDNQNHTVLKGTVTSGTVPVVTTSPASQTVATGGAVVFSVAATGAAPLAYQWQKNGVNLAGQIGATLTLTNVQPADAAAYNAIVSNSTAAVPSTIATLSVIPPVTGLPGAPSNLTVSLAGGVLTATWLVPSTGGTPTGYIFEAGSAPALANIAVVPVGAAPIWTYTGGVPDGRYFLRVRAQNASGVGPASNEFDLIAGVGAPPAAPTQLTGNITNGLLTLQWVPGSGGGPVASHVIEAGTAVGLTNIGSVPSGGGATFQFAGVPAGRYFLRVRALNARGPSPPSNELELAFGLAGAPGAPQNLIAQLVGRSLTLTWTPASGPAATSFLIEAGTASGLSNAAILDTGSTQSAWSYNAVPPGQVFFIRVRARNAVGSSFASNEVTIGPADLARRRP